MTAGGGSDKLAWGSEGGLSQLLSGIFIWPSFSPLLAWELLTFLTPLFLNFPDLCDLLQILVTCLPF